MIFVSTYHNAQYHKRSSYVMTVREHKNDDDNSLKLDLAEFGCGNSVYIQGRFAFEVRVTSNTYKPVRINNTLSVRIISIHEDATMCTIN